MSAHLSFFKLCTGTLFALLAGAVWGLVFVVPLMLPDYPAALLSVGRYLAFGLIALPLAWLDRKALARLSRADWIEALKLTAVGNFLYYLCLAAAIQRAGGPLPTVIIGTLPVVIALVANARAEGHSRKPVEWLRLGPSLLLIVVGVGLVNQTEMQHLQAQSQTGVDWRRYGIGALLAVCAVACWTWYPLRNADWLRQHADRNPRSWATAQGLATLPLALAGSLAFWAYNALSNAPLPLPGGPSPERFVWLMLATGLLASWLGTVCWNEASQRLPTHLAGQLIVFETLAALTYVFVLRGQWPGALTALGMALLVAGVLWALHTASRPPTA
jgi:drug/metabolite transporter (DMT)-like permease